MQNVTIQRRHNCGCVVIGLQKYSSQTLMGTCANTINAE